MNVTFSRVQRWATVGLMAVVLLLVAQMLYREREQLLAYPWRIHAPSLLLAFAGHALALHGTFVVWGLIMRRLAGSADPGWRTHFSIYYPTALAKRMPGTVWYAAGRLWLYEQQGVAPSVTLAALVLEMVVITVASLLFFLLTWPLAAGGQGAALASLQAVPGWIPLLLVGVAVALLWPGVLERLINAVRRRLRRPEVRLTVGYRDVLVWVGIDLLVALAAGIGFFGVVGVVYPAPLTDLAPLMLLATLATLFSIVGFVVPVLPLVREATVAALLATTMPLAVAVVIAILYRLVWTLGDLCWALVALRVIGGDLPPRATAPLPQPPVA